MKGLKKYFLDDLPSKEPSIASKPRYVRIRRYLQSHDFLAQLHFLVSVGDVFNRFLMFFQRDEPLIHLLYDQMSTVFIKNDVLANKTAKKLSEINLDDVNNRLSYKEVEIGKETRRAISKFSSEQQRKFELGAVSFLVKRLILGNVILRSVRVLKPGARKESWTL